MSAFEMNTISKQMEQVNFNKDDQEREVSFSQNSATSGHLSFLKDGKPYNYCRVETKTATEIIKNVFKKNVPEGETRTEMMDEAINSVISKALNQYYILKKKIKGDEEKGVGENIIRGHELKSGKLKKDLDTAKYGNKILKEGKGNPAYNKLDKSTPTC